MQIKLLLIRRILKQQLKSPPHHKSATNSKNANIEKKRHTITETSQNPAKRQMGKKKEDTSKMIMDKSINQHNGNNQHETSFYILGDSMVQKLNG